MSTQDWLIEWFATNSPADKDEALAHLDDNYFDLGWIDSFQFMLFLVDIEEHFAISLDNEAFEDRAFATIKGLSRIIDAAR
jgi:acyl carrier protein